MTRMIETGLRFLTTLGRHMKIRNLFGLALVAAVMPVAGAWGENVTFTVDPARSALTLSGTGYGLTILAQGSDSLITSYTGMIICDREVAPYNLQITSGTINATGSGYWGPYPQPLQLFDISPAPGNYGFTMTTIQNDPAGDIVTEYLGAIRDFSLSITSPLNLTNSVCNCLAPCPCI